MSNTLSYNDHYDNYAEGWGVFYTSMQDAVHNLYEIQRVDETEKFESDEDAIRFVVNEALKDKYGRHARALVFVAKESPNELGSYIKGAVGDETYSNLLATLNIVL